MHGLDVRQETRLDYQKRTTKFLKFCKRNGGITPTTLIEYKRMVAHESSLGVSAKNKYLSAARITLRQLHKLGYIPIDLSSGVKNFQQSRRHKRVGLNEEEMERVGLLVSETVLNGKYRTAAIAALLTYQGLRQIEVCRLKFTDMDFRNKKILILGKGRDDTELIEMHPCVEKAVYLYMATELKVSGNDNPDTLPLFPSRKNRAKPITTRQIRNIVRSKLFEPLDIQKTVHGFRHYYATQLIKHSGGNLLQVRQFTRHRSIEMLQTYFDETETSALRPQFHAAIPTFPVFEAV